jgi:hypothetical protein
MLKQKYIWINAKAFNQREEEIDSGMSKPQLGIANTGCKIIIELKLVSVRQVIMLV